MGNTAYDPELLGPGYGDPHNPTSIEAASDVWEFFQEYRLAMPGDATALNSPSGEKITLTFEPNLVEVDVFKGLDQMDHWEISRKVTGNNGRVNVAFGVERIHYRNGYQDPLEVSSLRLFKKPVSIVDSAIRMALITHSNN